MVKVCISIPLPHPSPLFSLGKCWVVSMGVPSWVRRCLGPLHGSPSHAPELMMTPRSVGDDLHALESAQPGWAILPKQKPSLKVTRKNDR